MIKYLLTVLLFISQLFTFAQDKLILGKITDITEQPLLGVEICESNCKSFIQSDNNEIFHLLIDKQLENRIDLSYLGFESIQISNIDTVKEVLNINMTPNSLHDSIVIIGNNSHKPKNKLKRNINNDFIVFFQRNLLLPNFDDFKPILKDYNVNLMNTSIILSTELAVTFNRYYSGVSLTYNVDEETEKDSLDIKLKSSQIGFHFGYNLVNNKRFLITPKVAIKWNRYRLLNSYPAKEIPLEQYISERDIDIRYNQFIGSIGLNLLFKFYKCNIFDTDFWTCGIYGGYEFKLHDKPLIYTVNNRISSNGKIRIEDYNFGILFSFNLML